MPSYQPTDEQVAIIDAARKTPDNLLVNALAGAAKTTTLEMICNALPANQPILSLAFNKKIADELGKRLPGHVRCATLNAIGHRVWGDTIGRRLNLDTKKLNLLMKDHLSGLSRFDREDLGDQFSETLKIVQRAKMMGYIPEGLFPDTRRLTDKETFYASLDDEPSPLQVAAVESILRGSINQAFDGLIDFDDQLYMSVLFGSSFPKFGLTMVDEAQDLSPINHAFLGKLVRDRRAIAVGDPWQAIYGFRGAMTNSMAALKAAFGMTEMTLSTSFRCPRAVVRHVHGRVPHMRWPEWAIEGQVATLTSWDAQTIPDGAAVICRNNAPLFSAALAMIRNGRGVQLLGADIGPGLVRILKKLGNDRMPQEAVLVEIERWQADALKKSRTPDSVADRAECLRVFASQGPTLAAAIAYAEHIFSCKGPIQLMSGHKSKGLEFQNVYHLDPWRVPSKWVAPGTEEFEQELNVQYVISTRAKETLTHINMEDFGGAA